MLGKVPVPIRNPSKIEELAPQSLLCLEVQATETLDAVRIDMKQLQRMLPIRLCLPLESGDSLLDEKRKVGHSRSSTARKGPGKKLLCRFCLR